MSSETLVTFQEESFNDVIDDIKPLLENHWQEIALDKDKIALNPDYAQYENMYKAGVLKVFTARLDDELVGYFVVMLHKSPHYSDHILALNDIIYLKPEYRKTGVGKRLISFAEQILHQEGVSVLYINTKVHQPFDLLMESLNYTLAERVYSKYIGE